MKEETVLDFTACASPDLHAPSRSAADGSLRAHIARRTAAYAALPVFQAFHSELIPWARFPDFFREQYLAARHFQDLIWACTEINDGEDADWVRFAADHRKRDSGHFHWMEKDLETFGLAVDVDDVFSFAWRGTRQQMARILGHLAGATAARRLIALAALENAGAVTLGTLFAYVARHGQADRLLYLGEAHIAVERGQVDALLGVAHDLLEGDDVELHATVDLVFDALSTMFAEGGARIYGDLIAAARAS